MKKIIALIALISILIAVPVMAQEQIRIDVNSQPVNIDIRGVGETIMVPAEEVSTILNLEFNYDESTNTAVIKTRPYSNEKRELKITAKENKYYYNGTSFRLSNPAQVINGRLYITYDLFDRLGFNSQYTTDTGARVINILSKNNIDMSYFGAENNVLVNKNPKLDLTYAEQIKKLEERYGKTFKEQDSTKSDHIANYSVNNNFELQNKGKYSLLVIKRLDSETEDLLKITLEALSPDGEYLYEKIEEAFNSRINMKNWEHSSRNDIVKNIWYRVSNNDYGDTSYRFDLSDRGDLEVEITDKLVYTPYGIEWNN